ncbi:MAG TPA: hypothetical protein VFW64_02130 [Pseudonocardiaceae bacterium]|nr:hypothetical protein [Pseudonocardiaceae bacterium]
MTGAPRDHSMLWRFALLVAVVISFLRWHARLVFHTRRTGLVGFGFSLLYALTWHCH